MKKALLLTVLTVAVLAMVAVPAFAEGYNDGGYNYTTKADETGYGDNAGIYVRNPVGDAQVAQGITPQGPHGGYNTTTNKCQDCHSTHYATGSYMLLRANSREDACTFCHAGGGGSSLNIQMDNAYDIDGVIASDGNYRGTGHTLGYDGKAPADIEPAFQDTAGLACFSCHTPHGNSARVIEAFGSPARPAGDGYVQSVYGVPFMVSSMYGIQEAYKVKFDFGVVDMYMWGMDIFPDGSYFAMPDDLSTMTMPESMGGGPMFLKWMDMGGGPILIEDTVDIDFGVAQGNAMISTELADAKAAFMAWMMGSTPVPTNQAIATWYMTEMDTVPADADGYKRIGPAELGALFTIFGADMGTGDLGPVVDLFLKWKVYWGEDVKVGNIATMFLNMGNYQIMGDQYGYNPADFMTPGIGPELEVWHKPLFPKGRFLLLKNPDSGDDYDVVAQLTDPTGDGFGQPGFAYARPLPDMKLASTDETANAANGKKVGIDWEWPLGPAATWGPFFYTDNNERFPLQFPWAPKGVAMENEVCTSCHDGAAGLSSQKAKVWLGDDSAFGGDYIVAYSHDSNNRGCARAQYLEPEDDNNFGPHCANCHTGSGGCYTCHDESGTNWKDNGPGYDADTVLYEGLSSYQAPAAVRASAVVVDYQCIDGGFSYPHRTLGANLLKDALYGVDFDGTPVAPGEPRMAMASVLATFGASYFGEYSFDAHTITGQNAHNLDSVCIDCHGNATYWNGDDQSYYADFSSTNPLNPAQSWEISGWDLLLKGLP